MRAPKPVELQFALRLVVVLLLIAIGALLLTDRPGLRAEYFSLGPPWEGRPVYTTVGEPALEKVSEIRKFLATDVVFSVRWRGWWAVAEGGEHRFALDAEDGGYLRIGDELLVDTGGSFGEPRPAGTKTLEPGRHVVDIGLYQTTGESRLAVHWEAPGTVAKALPPSALFAGRPLAVRSSLRRALETWPRVYRRLLGAVLLIAGALMLRGLAPPFGVPLGPLRSRLPPISARGLRVALLLALYVLTFLVSLLHTGTVMGGDDTAYLSTAYFGGGEWYIFRFAHVYLLKLFITLCGGDPFVAVRVWWSFVAATTVAFLAVAIGSIGPGLQLPTLAATLFVLFAQPTATSLIGAAFADYTAMMFVTAAVAVYLHGVARDRDPPSPRHEWHALAVGALTVAAYRSKEVGAVLALLPLLFLIRNGRLDLRSFVRRTAYWVGGAVGVFAILAMLDGWHFGDFFPTFDSERLAKLRRWSFPLGLSPRKETQSWFHAVWSPGGPAAGLAGRHLWLGVLAAAVVAGIRRRSIELRLLHLLPIAYLAALIVLYIRMPHLFSGRILIPILPVACLMTGLVVHYCGLDEVSWRRLLTPVVVVPTALAATVLFVFVVPYQLGSLEAATFLPGATLGRYGWSPDHFVTGVLLPILVLVVVSALALAVAHRRVRFAALLVAYLVLFGVGFEASRRSLSKGWSAQTGELLLYPWRTFRDELEAARPRTIVLSPDLQWRYRMTAATRSRLAALALGRSDVQVTLSRHLAADADVAIVSSQIYRRWLRSAPALAATARFDPGGLLVLVRPKAAAELRVQ